MVEIEDTHLAWIFSCGRRRFHVPASPMLTGELCIGFQGPVQSMSGMYFQAVTRIPKLTFSHGHIKGR